MSIEIERRFIVEGELWKKYASKPKLLKQGYLSINFEEWVIRLRIIDDKESFLTLKSRIGERRNYDLEYNIPYKDAELIFESISRKVFKKRYSLNFSPGEWIVDCFEGTNKSLVLAEVALPSEEVSIPIPNWCSKEITGIKKFSNASLATNPISNWNMKERQIFDI